MITKLLNEVNEKIEKLNNLVQDKEYFKKLEERIEKVNNYAQEQKQEIERLNNIINELNNAYCKVITKCEEIIDNRFYMNDIAIKKYADEIKDICKYYVGEAKELKGVDEE